jgi:hypothetical protein
VPSNDRQTTPWGGAAQIDRPVQIVFTKSYRDIAPNPDFEILATQLLGTHRPKGTASEPYSGIYPEKAGPYSCFSILLTAAETGAMP